MKPAEYYIERIGNEKSWLGGEKSFNLWAKVKATYYNIATLSFHDVLCGDRWTIDDAEKAVSYSELEIKDETENPLQSISQDKAKRLLSMKDSSPEEVAKCFESILSD